MTITARADGKVGLNILQESPLVSEDWHARDVAAAASKPEHWVPSRYNVRATVDGGRLILWNTLSNAMSVFTKEQAQNVIPLLKKEGFTALREEMTGYLVERGFLVRKGSNEYRQFLLEFGKQHYRNDRLTLILMPSEDCNFRCTYCYEDFARGTMLPSVRSGIKRYVEKCIEDLRTLGISWFGGEPLYGWAAIEDLAPFFLDLVNTHNVGYATHMTTNGYLLTPDVAERLLSWRINDFQITIDGSPEHHDVSRPTRDGHGTFWKILENLKNLAQRRDDFAVGVRVNFDQGNVGGIDAFLDIMQRELGGDSRFSVHFEPVGRWGGSNDEQLQPCEHDQQSDVMLALKAAAYQRGLRFTTLRDINRLGSRVCYAARPNNFLIGAGGKIMKCTVVLDKEDHNVVGRVTEDGDFIIDQERFALWTEPAFERDQQCQRCVVLPSCQGISCPLPRIRQELRPCISTRTHAKDELAEALKFSFRDTRVRQIRGT